MKTSKRNLAHVSRTTGRWAAISVVLSAVLFAVAGTMRILSIFAYLVAFSAMLLIAMLSVSPELARERAHHVSDETGNHLRMAAGFFFLLTVISAAFCVSYLSAKLAVSPSIRCTALAVFIVSSSLQLWAMIANPFFSPVVRLQTEKEHRLIESGPYRYIRHPGYLAMCISVPASALAIGSWLALAPATAFVLIIRHRVRVEEHFLKLNLPAYAEYARRVPSGLPFHLDIEKYCCH